MSRSSVFAWAWLFVAVVSHPTLAADDPGATVQRMFNATRAMDVDGVVAQLSSKTEPEIIYYWGETVTGHDAIRQWHREWFEEKGWRLEPEQIGHVFAGERVASMSYTIEYVKTEARRFKILIGCTLVREDQGWKIARMQQTLLDGPKD